MWGFSFGHAFWELPHMQAGEWREEEVTFDTQAERLAVPTDPALLDELDEWLDVEVCASISELDAIAGRLARAAVAHGASWGDVGSSLRLEPQDVRAGYGREDL